MEKENKKSIYKIYNPEKGYGSPFTLCDKCYESWTKLYSGVVHTKIAEKSLEPCNECGN